MSKIGNYFKNYYYKYHFFVVGLNVQYENCKTLITLKIILVYRLINGNLII